jgi:hypothetical protein
MGRKKRLYGRRRAAPAQRVRRAPRAGESRALKSLDPTGVEALRATVLLLPGGRVLVHLRRIMKNKPQRLPCAAAYATDAVAQLYAVNAFAALLRALAHGEDGGFTLAQSDDLRA